MSDRFYKFMGVAMLAYGLSFVPTSQADSVKPAKSSLCHVRVFGHFCK